MKRPSLVKVVWMMSLVAVACGAVFARAAEDLIVQAYRYGLRDVDQPGLWAVMLRFSSPVFPSNVAQNTTVTMRGVGKPFQLLEHDSRQKATKATTSLILVPKESSDKPSSVTVFISKGLSDATGRRLLAKDFAYTFLAYEQISVTHISSFYTSKKERGVRLSLSSQVSEQDLSPAIEVHPKVDKLSIARDQGRNYTITGEFEFNEDYVLKISPEKVANGTAVLEFKEFRFKGPGVKPEIAVNSDGSVVELKSRQLLPLRLTNVTKVRCEMVKVPALLAAEVSDALDTREGGKKPIVRKRWRGPRAVSQKPTPQEGGKQVDIGQMVAEFKRVAASSNVSPLFVGQVSEDAEAFFAKDGKDAVSGYSLPLSFRKNPGQGGSWLVTLSDPDTPSADPTAALIQITDLSVSYKVSSETLLVWVTSIYEGQPVPGAEILLIGADGRRYFAGKTDKDGLLKLRNRDKAPAVEAGKYATPTVDTPVDLAQLTSIHAATPSDSCGVRLRSVRLKPSSVPQTAKVAAKPEMSPNGHVFTERGVYKPGETVHFKFVSRVYRDKRIVPPAGEMVKVEIVGPRNDVNYGKELPLSEFGSCWDSLQTKAFFPVGNVHHHRQSEKIGRRRAGIHQHISSAGIQEDPPLRKDLGQERAGRNQGIYWAQTLGRLPRRGDSGPLLYRRAGQARPGAVEGRAYIGDQHGQGDGSVSSSGTKTTRPNSWNPANQCWMATVSSIWLFHWMRDSSLGYTASKSPPPCSMWMESRPPRCTRSIPDLAILSGSCPIRGRSR